MQTYQARIKTIAPLHNARHIEAFMRSEHSTLDAMSTSKFRREVVICAHVVDQAGAEMSEKIAQSFGL